MIHWTFLLLLMVLMHCIADFHIQGIMGQMKQVSFWTSYGMKYRNDWKGALVLHGMEWSILVSLPLLLACQFDVSPGFAWQIFCMGWLHASIDSLKCNHYWINTNTDQALHMIQIVWLLFVFEVLI